MAELTVQEIAESGLDPSYGAAAGGGDTFDNFNGDTFLHVKNGGGGSINVTIAAQKTSAKKAGFGDMTKSNLVVAVPAGGERTIGNFPVLAFNDANGEVVVTYSGVTSVTVAAIKLPRN